MKINELARLPEKIPCDKRLHYMLGTWFAFIEVVILVLTVLNVITLLIALILLCVFAWAIEFSQKWLKWGKYDNNDALAVVLGGLIVILPFCVLMFKGA